MISFKITGVDQPHSPLPQGDSTAHESNPPTLAANLEKFACTRVYHTQKATPEGQTQTRALK